LINRVPKIEKFTQIQNNIVERNDISGLAKAILWYCLTKPDNWNFYMGDISNHFQSDSNNGIRKAIKELENNGFIVRNKVKTTTNFIWEWNIYEEPILKIYEVPILKIDQNKGVIKDIKNNTGVQKQISGFTDCLYTPDIVRLTTSNTIKEDIKDNSPAGAYAPPGQVTLKNSLGKEITGLYYRIYKEKTGAEHCKISKERINSIMGLVNRISNDIGVDIDMWERMIRYYMFKAKFKIEVDYNINHFMSNGILSVYLEREFGKPVLNPSYVA